MNLVMKKLSKKYAVIKLPPNAMIPLWIQSEMFVSITRTDEELSIMLDEGLLGDHLEELQGAEVFKGFAGLKIQGPLDFSLIGILAEISSTLAKESISIFAISTFDTDYIFLGEDKLSEAVKALEAVGITVK